MTQRTATQGAVTHLATASEGIVNNAPRTFTDAEFPVGTVSHQGDLIFVRVASLPQSATCRRNRQLAEGSTSGSRHILTIGDAFDCPPDDVSRAVHAATGVNVDGEFCGPLFATRHDAASVEHPEHGHQHFVGHMTVAVVYQRNLDAQERQARVMD